MVDTVAVAPALGLPDIVFAETVLPLVPLVADTINVLGVFGVPQWGVYLGGQAMVVADIVTDLAYSKPYTISDYPIEGGSFASYNKVEQPYEGRIRFASGGSPEVRQALISSVEGIVGDLNLYDLVTSDQVYLNANIVREEYRRTSTEGGASLLVMDVSFQEVRVLASYTLSNTTDPASADQSNSGTVQPQTPGPGQPATALGQGGIGSDANVPTFNSIPTLTPSGTAGIGAN